MRRTLLFDGAPADGGSSTPEETGARQSAATPPPAASAVVNSDAQPADAEELVKLRRSLAESEEKRKAVELRAMELEDNLRTLTTPPKPTPKRRAPSTFFDEEDSGAD